MQDLGRVNTPPPTGSLNTDPTPHPNPQRNNDTQAGKQRKPPRLRARPPNEVVRCRTVSTAAFAARRCVRRCVRRQPCDHGHYHCRCGAFAAIDVPHGHRSPHAASSSVSDPRRRPACSPVFACGRDDRWGDPDRPPPSQPPRPATARSRGDPRRRFVRGGGRFLPPRLPSRPRRSAPALRPDQQRGVWGGGGIEHKTQLTKKKNSLEHAHTQPSGRWSIKSISRIDAFTARTEAEAVIWRVDNDGEGCARIVACDGLLWATRATRARAPMARW